MMRTVIITGTSSGIGRATAELMAQRGWQVVATSRGPERLAAWAQQHRLDVLPLDLSDESSIESLVGTAVERFGRIDALVNNAGFGIFGPLEGASSEDVEAYFQVHLAGVLSLIKHVMPAMRCQRDGAIVNVSSVGGRTASPFASPGELHGVGEKRRCKGTGTLTGG
jgi:NAD(P)-dependent dehydrogenase (short-subunit alcohol dehydrogenase family)